MEFRTMIKITLYARQQNRHWCIEQSFGFCGRGWGLDDLEEWHWNLYNIVCEMNRQSRFNAWYRLLWAGALGWHREMVWGGRWFRMGIMCTLVVDSCWCMAKPIRCCKVISLQLKKRKKKKTSTNKQTKKKNETPSWQSCMGMGDVWPVDRDLSC